MARISLQLGFQKLPCCFFAALVCECVHSGGYLKVFWGEASIKGVFSLPVDYYIFSRLNEWAFSWTDLAVKKYSHFAIQSSPRLQMSQLRGKQKNQKTENVIAGKWMLVCFCFFLLNVSLFSPVSASPSVIWHLQICLYTCVSSPSTHSCAGDTRVGRN